LFRFQSDVENIRLIKAFATMLASQDVNDTGAMSAETVGDELNVGVGESSRGFEALALKQDDKAWERLMSSPRLRPSGSFSMKTREIAKSKMRWELNRSVWIWRSACYHAWNRLYNKLAGDLRAGCLGRR